MTEGNSSTVGELLEGVNNLQTSVEKHSETILVLARRQRRNLLLAYVAIVGLVVMLCLTGLVIYLYVQLHETTNRIDCQANLRAELQTVADRDRNNVYTLIEEALSGKYRTPAKAKIATEQFQKAKAENDAARAKLGANNASTCK